ncbi:unnamed protein product [Phytophthora fragariaefolia]|uniref:Unnamed protein product n=1 Tax=Phytophthora fragariaefolia TaxID=1490495 RepID=A0A9W6X073_9STRA|nr:unnamed protein product [Phytophthora fragariaefolia]
MLLAVSPRRRRRLDVAAALDVKIIDFGFAKVLSEGATSTSFLGTGGYLAPEVLLRQPYGKAVDMWSFGVLTYLLLCGRLPFAATTQLRPNQKIQSLYKLTFPKRSTEPPVATVLNEANTVLGIYSMQYILLARRFTAVAGLGVLCATMNTKSAYHNDCGVVTT